MRTFRKTLGVLLAGFMSISATLGAADFLRGDVDGSGRLAVSDAIRILAHLFQGDPSVVPCEDAADVDDSGAIDLADAVHLLAGLFLWAPAPAAPFPGCGEDRTEDALGCDEACPPMSVFYGKEFRADGLFFVVDRTMDASGTVVTKLPRAKLEMQRLIEALPPGVEFGIIFFSSNVIAFPAAGRPAESTEEMKASAVAFIRNTPGAFGSCGMPGLLAAIEFARISRARRPEVYYVGHDTATCQGAQEAPYMDRLLETVTAQNAGLVRIHTFQVSPGISFYDQFLEQLALRNGGTYTAVR